MDTERRAMRRRRGGEQREEGAAGERNSRVARTPKLVCHSVRQSAYSQALDAGSLQYLRKLEYLYIFTHTHTKGHVS